MSYAVKEIFYSLQGEGANAGRPTVFVRFAGCNLWSGREEDRVRAICRFCDTDFLGTDGSGGGIFASPAELASGVTSAWPAGALPSPRPSPTGRGSACERYPRGRGSAAVRPLLVLTGGEPLLQVDETLLAALRKAGFEIAVETNGTLPVPPGADWLSVSPKAGTDLVIRDGDELKLVYPQEGAEPQLFEGLDFRHFFLQPMDGAELDRNTRLALDYCLGHPQWRLSLQVHKLLGIP